MKRGALICVFALILAGCGSSTSTSSNTTSTTTAAAAKGPSEAWTGFGSTLTAWETAHPKGSGGNGSGCTGEGCYGEKVTVEGESVYQFTSFGTSGSPEYRVTGYEQALGDEVSIEAAKGAVLKLMPADTKPTAFFVGHSSGSGGSCALWNLKSATLGHLFAKDPKIGDASGEVGVDFNATNKSTEEPSYSPTNVTHATVSIAPSSPGTTC